MRPSLKNLRPLLTVIALTIPSIISAKPAIADTYVATYIVSDGSAHPVGIDDAGDFVISERSGEESPCGADAVNCFYTYYVGDPTPVVTATLPDLDYDNGAECEPVLFPGLDVIHGVCNNNHSVVGGDYLSGSILYFGVWTGPDPITDRIYPGSFDGGEMNANGDVVFDDEEVGGIIYLTDLSTVTPEPSTFILLGTGCLSLLGALRRRAPHI